MSQGIHLLIVGASGAVGQSVVKLALANKRVARVTAPTRRLLKITHAKLDNPLVDFSHLPDDQSLWRCDAVICTLGTTIRIAGSQAAFAAIDRDLPITVGKLAKAAGARRYALNSSLGASLTGNFYLRTKAEAENGVSSLGYDSVTIVRPSLIDAEREQSRPAEKLGILFARALKPLIPQTYRAVTPEQIAKALLEGAIAGKPGVAVIESRDL